MIAGDDASGEMKNVVKQTGLDSHSGSAEVLRKQKKSNGKLLFFNKARDDKFSLILQGSCVSEMYRRKYN